MGCMWHELGAFGVEAAALGFGLATGRLRFRAPWSGTHRAREAAAVLELEDCPDTPPEVRVSDSRSQ